MVRIISAKSEEHFDCARNLFLKYAEFLGVDLEFQGFSRELDSLPGDYASPNGCILLAEVCGTIVGCAAVRPFAEKICEMKRLFVVPDYQGRGLGKALACAVIDRARDMGYEKMRLDTIASMEKAKALYSSLRFRTIEPYRYNPLENPSYMELDLQRRAKMIISLIVAMASNRVIGDKGDIPWKIPGEQKMFKEITMGHCVIMGRKTFESLERPLPGRTNIVVTRQSDYKAPGCTVVHSLEDALKSCPPEEKEAFICGGGQLYRDSFAMADRIYLTVIPREIPGDTYFPEIPEAEFVVSKSDFIDGVEPYHFYIYERKTC